MSKREKVNPSDAQETTVESQNGVPSTNESVSETVARSFLKTNVNNHTEKKNGLTYLSWAWAWAEVIKTDANATFEVKQFNGLPYMDVNGTGMVWVSVKIFDQERTCMLPVMDYRNKPITNPDAFQVNTAIMRCLVKAIALHGLGLYIYAGEDLPEDDTPAVEKAPPVHTTKYSEDESTLFAEKMIEYADQAWHVQSVNDLSGYWRANQERLDDLKKDFPTMYETVKNHFTDLKEKFKSIKE